jgi:hypothetical protein
MTQVRERAGRIARPEPDEAVLTDSGTGAGRRGGLLRMLGALAVLVVGVVHLEQYVAADFHAVSVIGPLFVLNFAGACVIALGLLLPLARRLHVLLALAGIALAATSFVFLLISEHQPLFGFHEHGYRAAIVISLVAEAIAVLLLGGYLAVRERRG